MPKTATAPHVCPSYLAIFLDNWVRRWFQSPLRILDGYIQTGDTALDIGCGPGFFTLAMASMVGKTGQVYAIDLQASMLTRVGQKAARKGLTDRIHRHKCRQDRIDLEVQADFALAFYMVHETPSVEGFFREVYAMIRPGGRFLVVEPRMHVRRPDFDDMCQTGERLGWMALEYPKKKGGHSVLFQRL